MNHDINKLEKFFREIAKLTLDHRVLQNDTVDPYELNEALKKVDPEWWRLGPVDDDVDLN